MTDIASRPPRTAPRRLPRLRTAEILVLAALPIAVLAAIAGIAYTGAEQPALIIDPGPLVRNGLPVARAIHDVAAALTIGLTLMAALVLPGQRSKPGLPSFAQWTSARLAVWSTAVWLASAIAVTAFTAANVIGVPLSSPTFRGQIMFVLTDLELGQALTVSCLCIAGALISLLLSIRTTAAGFALALSILALLPLSLSGHSAGALEHGNAVNSLAVHLIGVCVWFGGLAALVLVGSRIPATDLPTAVRRYSVLALWSFLAVAASGTLQAALRLQTPAELITTTYGNLLLVKITALVALGAAGAFHRRIVIPRFAAETGRRRVFVRLAVAETLVMGLTIGVSVALSKSAPPVPQESVAAVDPRASLLGFPYPPAVDVPTFLTAFHADWLMLAVCAGLVGFYLAAVRRLRTRGVAWPLHRTLSWILGCLGLAFATSGGPGVYGAVHFSTHMIQHMALMMYIPPLLVLGAPILLALRALAARRDGSRGPREWLLWILHSGYARVVTNPLVAAVIFAGSLVAFYYTDWFQFSLETHQGHVLMTIHFLLSGFLFFTVLIGEDPLPSRPSYPMRLVLLLVTMAFHAFFGLSIMARVTVLATDWWVQLGQSDTAALLADQGVGGGIAWGAGELPIVVIALIVVRQWIRSDERTATRLDRAADRDDDAALKAYNDGLSRLSR